MYANMRERIATGAFSTLAMTSVYGGQKKSQAFAWLVVFALPIFLGRPSIVMPSATVRGTVAGIKNAPYRKVRGFVFALPIFPGSRPPSIVGASELNFCVRDGNRWTLTAINTNYINGF